jgi:hypothetical protein
MKSIIKIAFLLFLSFQLNAQNKIREIKFEIIDQFGPIAGLTIRVNSSLSFDTDINGKTIINIDNSNKIIELSYMGRPTFVKIIKDSNFIKVDLSKRKALYYKNDKFICRKKLIYK